MNTLGGKILDLDGPSLVELAAEADALEEENATLRVALLVEDDVRRELHEEIDSLKTTLTEDLAYQEKLEGKIERVEALADRLDRRTGAGLQQMFGKGLLIAQKHIAMRIREALANADPESHHVTEPKP